MATAEVKKSYFVAIDSDLGAAAIDAQTALVTTWASDAVDARTAFLLEPSGLPDLSLDYEEVTRDVIRDSYLPASPLRGIINSTGSMTFELHGGGVNGATWVRKPDYAPMLKSGFGAQTFVSADAVGTTDDLSAVSVGGSVVISGGTAGHIYVYEDASGDVAVVQATGTTTGLLMYKDTNFSTGTNKLSATAYSMPAVLGGIPNFALAYYRANIVRELYAKCAVTSIEFPFTAGELVLPTVNFNVSDGTVAAETYQADSIFANKETRMTSDIASPLFAKAVDWDLQWADVTAPGGIIWDSLDASATPGDHKCVDSFTLTLNNESSTIKCITEPEGIKSYGVQGRSVELSLSAYYDDYFTDNLTKLFTEAGNKYRLRISAMKKDGGKGNRFFIFAPRMSFKPVVAEADGLFKYDVTGQGEKDPVFGENALTCVFF